MKTSVNRLKNLIFVAIFIMQVFFFGCGGSGGNAEEDNDSPISDSIYTINGRVLLSEASINVKAERISEFIATHISDTSTNCSIRKQSSLEQIIVRLAQQPAIYTICDENGNFKLSVPKIFQSVNLIAYKGTLNSPYFFIEKSKDIILEKETTINAGKIQLSQGKNTFFIKLKDKYNNPIKYAKCNFWGFEITSDINGVFTFPLFPESLKNVTATINAAGFKEFTNDYSVFTSNLGPVTELVLYSNDENKVPVVLNLASLECEPYPDQQVDLSVSVTDKSKVLGNSYSVKWTCTDGKFIKTDERNTNIWQAPANIGLATVTATVFVEGYESSVSIGLAVGKSRIVKSKIESFSPDKATAGQTITIDGIGFGINKGEVNFVGGGAQVLSWSDTQIKVLVPDVAGTGKITVKVANKTLTTEDEFAYIDYNIGLNVNYGVPGAEITIEGYGFGDKQEANSELLYDNEKIDNIVSWTNRAIKFKIEELDEATSPTSSLDLVIRGRKYSLGDFTLSYISEVIPEEVSRYTYESDVGRTLITIKGVGFGESDETVYGKSSVKFLTLGDNDEKEYVDGEVESWQDDKIEVYLPSKAQTGNIILKINDYEFSGPVITVIPSGGYSEPIDGRNSKHY